MDMSTYMTQAIGVGSSGFTAQTSGSAAPSGKSSETDFQSMFAAMVGNTLSPNSETLNATDLLKLNLQNSDAANAFSTQGFALADLPGQTFGQAELSDGTLAGDVLAELNQFGFDVTKNLYNQYLLDNQFASKDGKRAKGIAGALMDEAVLLQNGKAEDILQTIEELRKNQKAATDSAMNAIANVAIRGQFGAVNAAETDISTESSKDVLTAIDESLTQTTQNLFTEANQNSAEIFSEQSLKATASKEAFYLAGKDGSRLTEAETKAMENFEALKSGEQALGREILSEASTFQNLGSAQRADEKAVLNRKDEDLKVENHNGLTAGFSTEALRGTEVGKTETLPGSSSTPEAYRQVSDGVKMALGDGGKEFTMQLNPLGLGKINVKLSMTGQKLKIDIVAANPETQKLLLSQAESLAKELGLANINVDGVQIHAQTQGNRENLHVAATTGQDFDMSAGAGQQEGQQREQNARQAAASNHFMTTGELESLEEMSETYQMLKAEMGRLNYLA